MLRLQLGLIATVLAVSSAAVLLPAQGVLGTSIDHDNSQNGIMFDVHATSGDIRITGIDAVIGLGPSTVEVWRCTDGGTWMGHESIPQDWTLCGTNNVIAIGSSIPTPFGIPLDIEIKDNQYLGLYVTTITGSLKYTDGTSIGGLRATTTALELFEGVGKGYPFGATYPVGWVVGGPSRMFNGNIHYSFGSAGNAGFLYCGTTDVSHTGCYFDIRAKQPVTVEGFRLDLQANLHTLEVWTPRLGGSYAAAIGDPSKWMLAGKVVDYDATVAGNYDVGFDLDVPIATNETRGFYITRTTAATNDISIDQSSVPGAVVATNGDIDVISGNTCGYFLSGAGYSGAIPVMHVKYRKNLPGISGGLILETLTATNGINSGNGLFFDMAATGDFARVKQISAYLFNGTHNLELWIVRDRTTHLGKETDQSLWTRVATNSVTVTTGETLVPVFTELRIVLEPGMVQGCYITSTNGTFMSYEIAPQGVVYNSNSAIELRGGSRANYPFIPTNINRGPDIEVVTARNSGSLATIDEDFFPAGATEPPFGWFVHFADGNDHLNDGWRFDNPQPISPAANPPIDMYFAVVDTDHSGFGNPVDTFLYSPRFNAAALPGTLSFDHYHRPLGSLIEVAVWDGAVWNTLLSTTLGTANAEHFSADVSAATGGYSGARVRFHYKGNYDWHWAVDNVHLETLGVGQAPRPGLSVFDLNHAVEWHGRPVAANLPGPYYASGHTGQPAVFHWEGEPFQPVLLMHGASNPGGWDFLSFGKLDIGQYQPATGTFLNIEQLAYGGDPGLLNSLFVTNAIGTLDLQFQLPAFLIGQTINFQSLILSSYTYSSLTNTVRLFTSD